MDPHWQGMPSKRARVRNELSAHSPCDNQNRKYPPENIARVQACMRLACGNAAARLAHLFQSRRGRGVEISPLWTTAGKISGYAACMGQPRHTTSMSAPVGTSRASPALTAQAILQLNWANSPAKATPESMASNRAATTARGGHACHRPALFLPQKRSSRTFMMAVSQSG